MGETQEYLPESTDVYGHVGSTHSMHSRHMIALIASIGRHGGTHTETRTEARYDTIMWCWAFLFC